MLGVLKFLAHSAKVGKVLFAPASYCNLILVIGEFVHQCYIGSFYKGL